MFNPSSNTAQFCLADTALSSHSSLTPSLWRGQVFQNAWRGQVFQRLEEREKEKKLFSPRGEKFFVFCFFLLGPNGKWKKNFLGCEKFIFSPRHSTFQTRKSCSSRNKGLHFLLRTGSSNHKHGQQLQENELSAKLLQNHSLPKKKTFQLQKKVFFHVPCHGNGVWAPTSSDWI